MGLFDRLQKEIEDRGSGGISPLDLASLPPRLRKIMRLMLREVEMTSLQLKAAIHEWDEIDQLSDEELQSSLDKLTEQGWLIKLGQADLITYKVNLRRKEGSSLQSGIWAALDKKMKQDEDKPDSETKETPDA